ncbi:MAG: glycosyltransferase family 2 protein [Symplocastrum torsivum CPER-KK1]|jgi:glycosyltransferase involved in cell wall biosynthesis|uniref:Glycosyltransferase family 2 protein n=1 Tax=Symplocastrum torsivum CPER-KK1 TaxID=450513 RepID=A0A951PIX7_9CYAN|nr:glycosyltransferase family 2 protein [Symplocastrum torsivum CPER-KK1]
MGEANASKLEVIIPVKDRAEVMPCVQSLTQSRDKVARVIVCDGGSTEARCVESLHELERQDNVLVMHLPASGFNKARLINQGIAQATSDCLLISDADILWNEASLNALLNHVLSDTQTICYVQDVEESVAHSVALKRDRYTYNLHLDNDVALVSVVPGSDQAGNYRPGCGLICARRMTLFSLGGYKEIFTGWGWEDQDLLLRASVLGIQICATGRVLHLSHEDTARNRHHGNVQPIQTRNSNIITSMQSLAEGVLMGDLQMEAVIEPKPYVIRIQLPVSLGYEMA